MDASTPPACGRAGGGRSATASSVTGWRRTATRPDPSAALAYVGCHAWAIPTTCGDLAGAGALLTRLLGAEAQALDAAGGSICANQEALADVRPTSATDERRLELTRQMIDEAMITYPPLARFPEIEDAGWSAIRDALLGRRSCAEATEAIQAVAERVLG